MRFAFVASDTSVAQQAWRKLVDRYGDVPPEQAGPLHLIPLTDDLRNQAPRLIPGLGVMTKETMTSLLEASGQLKVWYDDLAATLVDGRAPRSPLAHDMLAEGRLLDAVRNDLSGLDGKASATAVRMIWTGDHLDAVRRLQEQIVGPLRAVR